MRLPAGHPHFGGEETSAIPNAKKPKVRPPRGMRDKFIFPGRSLPGYTGPYPVATMEIEVPAKNPQVFSHITREGRHVLQLETVLMTIYYPTSYQDFALQKHDSRFSRELWLGRPRWGMAEGMAKIGGVGKLGMLVFLPTMFTKLPAYRNAPIASYWAPEYNIKEMGVSVKRQAGTRPEGAEHDPVFPLILFSHGLAGTRTMYSSQCGEFASYGFIVCAVEHRDGSGPRTYVNHAKRGEGTREDLEKRAGIDHAPKEKKRGYDVIDYLWPKDNPKDTEPNNEKGVDTELRSAQICLRMAEIEEAYSVMCEIANGNGQLVADRNLRCKGFKASSSHGLDGVNWSRWKNRVRLDHVTACGHSFGAATVTEMLRHLDRFEYVSQGIIYDIWGAGTRPPEEEAPDHRITAPLLAINSEAFTYWPSNFELVKSLIMEAQGTPNPCPSWLMTLRGTVHVSQSDFSLLYPNITSFALKAVANPRRALDLNINASLEFLNHVLPHDIAQVSRAFQNEGLLDLHICPLSRIPTSEKHMPDDEYIAMKLKIKHEWLYRANPKMARKFLRKMNARQGRVPQPSDEVWLHVKPSSENIEIHLEHMESQVEAKRERLLQAFPLTPSPEAERRNPLLYQSSSIGSYAAAG